MTGVLLPRRGKRSCLRLADPCVLPAKALRIESILHQTFIVRRRAFLQQFLQKLPSCSHCEERKRRGNLIGVDFIMDKIASPAKAGSQRRSKEFFSSLSDAFSPPKSLSPILGKALHQGRQLFPQIAQILGFEGILGFFQNLDRFFQGLSEEIQARA